MFKKSHKFGRNVYNSFSFHAMNLPSDDSEDSSYEPTSDETTENNRKKRKRAKKTKTKARKRVARLPKVATVQHVTPNWSTTIPNELLQKIFSHGVATFGAVPFLCRCCQVCKKWNMVGCSPFLWKHVDLSHMGSYVTAKDEVVKNLIERSLWNQIEYLNLSNWSKLTSSALEMISTNCPGLRSLNLAMCGKVTARGLLCIASNCQNLTAINLSLIATDACSNMSLKTFLEQRGSQISDLCLAGNKTVGIPTMHAIQTWCANLKTLDVSNTLIRHIDVETFQVACPKLVELRLGQLNQLTIPHRNRMGHSNGFPDLELLSLATIDGGAGTDNMLLQRLLKTSVKLRQLDLRGCDRITHEGLLNLPVTSLEQLFLSRCKISWNISLSRIGCKWKHSLQNLDVSWGSNLGDLALSRLSSEITPNSVLTTLNLAGSGVTAVGVREILDSCLSLTELDLTSCRGVPRGLKQLHNKTSLEKLRQTLRVEPTQIDLDDNE